MATKEQRSETVLFVDDGDGTELRIILREFKDGESPRLEVHPGGDSTPIWFMKKSEVNELCKELKRLAEGLS
ncbi:MAG: hypothetical protein AAGA99_00475 [Actinomycetota bacterium]